MRLILNGLSSVYELERLAGMFFPSVEVRSPGGQPDAGDFIFASLEGGGACSVVISLGGERLEAAQKVAKGTAEKQAVFALARMMFGLLSDLTGIRPRWGILTGVRPVKLFHRAVEAGMGEDAVRRKFREEYLVEDRMIDLALGIQAVEAGINAKNTPDSFSLYVSIPFCPSRCSYCSFISHDVERSKKLIPDYVRLLAEEIRATGRIAKELGLRLRCVYFGGGTPTAIPAELMRVLFAAVGESFDFAGLLEYTVEAGRPDTIDAEKLRAIREAGATRLSVNPQSMRDEVLRAVGRKHTAADVERAFSLARGLGFDNINMDLIAGLPMDDPDGFSRTLDRVFALAPENVTVHTLAKKRSSALAAESQSDVFERRQQVSRMVDEARERLTGAGYRPYYLYRQKGSVDNLDNTGYAKPGREGCYNVYIMDETQTILAAGAGASTKLCLGGERKLTRIFNYKYPYEYCSKFYEILRRKEEVKRLYEASRVL